MTPQAQTALMPSPELVEGLLVELVRTVAGQDALRGRQDRLALRARAEGATWADLARALGMTAEGVRRRYTGLEVPDTLDA